MTDAGQIALYHHRQIELNAGDDSSPPNLADNMCTSATLCSDDAASQTGLLANPPRGHVPFTLGHVPTRGIC